MFCTMKSLHSCKSSIKSIFSSHFIGSWKMIDFLEFSESLILIGFERKTTPHDGPVGGTRTLSKPIVLQSILDQLHFILTNVMEIISFIVRFKRSRSFHVFIENPKFQKLLLDNIDDSSLLF
jgi:hypothetical protein